MGFSVRSLRRLSLASVVLIASLTACSDDTTEPTLTAPTALAAVALSPTSIILTWTASAGATGYKISRATGSSGGTFAVIAANNTTTTYTDAGLTPATTYRYEVVALRGTETSTAASVTTGSEQKPVVVLSGNLSTTRTLTADTAWVLSGFYKVRSGGTIKINAGTIIVGDTLVGGSSLWILPGGKIDAQGTATSPIVFTSQASETKRQPGDWGGVIIIGKGISNRGCPGNGTNTACVATTLTEGPAGGIQNTAENYAGGTDNNDNSGTMRYVRIEFAGYAVDVDQELNSLSMYAVGRGTTMEYLEALSGLDDSFEWFGGAVDMRYIVSYEAGDDHFDWTEGYRGRVQYMIGLQTYKPTPRTGSGFASADPRGFEGDGCETTKAGCADFNTGPLSGPVFANFTLVGTGAGVFAGVSTANSSGATIRRGSGGTLFNGMVARFQGIGLNVVDAQTDQRRIDDSLFISNVIFTANAGGNFNVAGTGFGQLTNFPNNTDAATEPATMVTALPAAGVVPTLAGLDWTPSAGSALATGGLTTLPTRAAARVTSFFGSTMTATAFRGAADPSGVKWWAGWTSYARN